MRNFLLAGAMALVVMGGASSASAATFTEDFEAPFPAWESGWFGQNSNANNCYGVGQDRGNNPDGLWISSTNPGGCNNQEVNVEFNAGFAASLTSFFMDVGAFSETTLSFFDKDDVLIQAFNVTLTRGATSDPGIYARYGVTSNNGIGRFHFSGTADGNTGIDNLEAITGGAVVPEPATWALMIGGFGLAGAALRRRRIVAA